jgi:four helix bundle protein
VGASDKLHRFGAYQKACELFDLVVEDMTPLSKNPLCTRLCSQQIASPDSISSNIEEGYGRASRADYARFLVISRGSATETRGRYEQRFKHFLNSEIISARVVLCEEIIAILSATLRTLRTRA